jgi:hypothetical protein
MMPFGGAVGGARGGLFFAWPLLFPLLALAFFWFMRGGRPGCASHGPGPHHLAAPVAAPHRSDVVPPAPDPLQVLRERYARGEIDQAEFERRVERLLRTEAPAAPRD